MIAKEPGQLSNPPSHEKGGDSRRISSVVQAYMLFASPPGASCLVSRRLPCEAQLSFQLTLLELPGSRVIFPRNS